MCSTEYSKVCFQCLVCVFGLAICLEMEGSAHTKVYSQQLSQGLKKVGRELWTSVRNDYIHETKAAINLSVENVRCSFRGNSFVTWVKDGGLGESLIDHYCNGVESVRQGEVSDEIDGHLLEWTRGLGFDRE